ncbi:sensor histidine kinase [Streptomyces iconiensis]|uniref:histidine kinase n=1 Tax=Streptomyces iconiensis TaxID=1384038 RepID=A0ABT6ZZU4_9ACTN|nr:histidine kinase [Streptomyces iconiensis]MDJ1134580.1 histidine kinase [Streptomyces iconiensis]
MDAAASSQGGERWGMGLDEGSDGGQPQTRQIHLALRRVRSFEARHPWLWDLLLPVLVALPGLGQLVDGSWRDDLEQGRFGPPPWAMPEAVGWLLTAGLVLPLLWRRRRPFPVFCAVSVPLFVAGLLGLGLPASAAIGVALYGVALRAPLSRLAWAGAVIAVSVVAELAYRPPSDPFTAYVPVVAIVVAITALGIAVRTRREYLASLLERAARLEVERDQRARLATAAERARIAREMHDIVAHNLSVITGLADGGSYAAQRSPERAREALEVIAATSRQALGDLRGLLGVLREGVQGAELSPQPGLVELAPLLDRVRAAGLTVRTAVDGSPGEGGEQSAGRQLVVYRVVQEALTNVLKHGGPEARATVTVTHAADGIGVDVVDTGTSGHGAPSGTGAGQGIGGMRERARAYGGTLEAGPLPAGGWRVHLWLPRSAAGATTVTDGASDDSGDRGRPGAPALRLPDAPGEPGRPDAPR